MLCRITFGVFTQNVVNKDPELNLIVEIPDLFEKIRYVVKWVALHEYCDIGEVVVSRNDMMQIGVSLAPDVGKAVLGGWEVPLL
ncbi:MAG: hypothetical protein R3C19_22515 [Planctomycetaceae bacterium]